MMMKIMVKDVANIVYEKEFNTFLVRFEEGELTQETIEKVNKVFDDLVEGKVSFILDMRNVKSPGKSLYNFLQDEFNNPRISVLYIVLNGMVQKTMFSLSVFFNKQTIDTQRIQIMYSMEKALDLARNTQFTPKEV